MMKTRFSACAAAVPSSTRATAAITKRMKSPQTGQNARDFGSRHRQCDGRVKLALTERASGAGLRCLDAKRVLDHCPGHERPNHHLRHLPGDYELATTLAAAVFSHQRDRQTPGQQVRGALKRAYNAIRCDGPETLRYAHARKAR